jgi:hypothetical protein
VLELQLGSSKWGPGDEPPPSHAGAFLGSRAFSLPSTGRTPTWQVCCRTPPLLTLSPKESAFQHLPRVAVVDNGRQFTYSDVLRESQALRRAVLRLCSWWWGPHVRASGTGFPGSERANCRNHGSSRIPVTFPFSHFSIFLFGWPLICSLQAGRSAMYVASLFAVWEAGGCAVPLCESHPPTGTFPSNT